MVHVGDVHSSKQVSSLSMLGMLTLASEFKVHVGDAHSSKQVSSWGMLGMLTLAATLTRAITRWRDKHMLCFVCFSDFYEVLLVNTC